MRFFVQNPSSSAPQVFVITNCSRTRFAAFVILRANVRRVQMTDALRANLAAKQTLYQHERRAWLKEWRAHYGLTEWQRPYFLNPQFVTATTLLLKLDLHLETH